MPSARKRKGAALVLPACNTEAMHLHLDEIAATVAPGAHAVLLLDQAGWHLSTRLDVPPNISLLPLPPQSPELNPVENIWQFMRQNWLSNRVFKSYDDIVDHCCDAWNTLVDQPWKIICPSACAIGRTGSDQWNSVLLKTSTQSPAHAFISTSSSPGKRDLRATHGEY